MTLNNRKMKYVFIVPVLLSLLIACGPRKPRPIKNERHAIVEKKSLYTVDALRDSAGIQKWADKELFVNDYAAYFYDSLSPDLRMFSDWQEANHVAQNSKVKPFAYAVRKKNKVTVTFLKTE